MDIESKKSTDWMQVILLILAAAVAMGLIGISIYGDIDFNIQPVEGNFSAAFFVKYVDDNQTLIGGLLAVGAAFITIRQMAKTDERADVRHYDLIKLQLAPQQNAFSTLQRIFYNDLNQNFMYQSAVLCDLEQMIEEGANRQDFLNYRILNPRMSDLANLLISSHWTVHRVGMSAETQAALDELRKSNEAVLYEFNRLGGNFAAGINQPFETCEIIMTHLGYFKDFIRLLKDD